MGGKAGLSGHAVPTDSEERGDVFLSEGAGGDRGVGL